jgi:protein involved in polysaccharide export with SLBB domain
VADGVPVRRLPVEILGRPKSDLKPIPLTLLRQRELDPYTLDQGDILAIVADDVIAPAGTQVPSSVGSSNSIVSNLNSTLPAIGFPVPVNDDGKISIARLKPIDVRGKTLAEVEELIKDTASGKFGGPELVNRALARVTVQLLQKRTYTVTVVREDTQPVLSQLAGGANTGGNKRGNGFTLKLQAGENDILHALNATGGPPGLDAKDEVLIYRGTYDPKNPEKDVTRIPLRIFPEQKLSLCEADVILRDGDVLKIESRDTSAEIYYVAGVAGSRQFPLPRDYDLDIIQALTLANAPLQNGGFSQTQFNGNALNTGLGQPTPALLTVLRQLPNNQQIAIRVDLSRAFRDPRERIRVLGGDILVMQERPGDAVTRYLYQTFRYTATLGVLGSSSSPSIISSSTFP